MSRMNQFNREYCHEVKSACLQAIANTSICQRGNAHDVIPAGEIQVALIDIMGTIAAMVEQSLPEDLASWAEKLTTQFSASFHAARAEFTTEELGLLQSCN